MLSLYLFCVYFYMLERQELNALLKSSGALGRAALFPGWRLGIIQAPSQSSSVVRNRYHAAWQSNKGSSKDSYAVVTDLVSMVAITFQIRLILINFACTHDTQFLNSKEAGLQGHF